jgi:lipoprotein NlpI
MMEVLALFGGKSTPAKVLAKARAGGVKGARLERQLFYAHLYLGLWYEATGEKKLRDQYIGLAAAVADNHGYMGDVARVHAELNKIPIPKPKVKAEK